MPGSSELTEVGVVKGGGGPGVGEDRDDSLLPHQLGMPPTTAGSAFRTLVDKSAILGILCYQRVGLYLPPCPTPSTPLPHPKNGGKEVLPEVASGL